MKCILLLSLDELGIVHCHMGKNNRPKPSCYLCGHYLHVHHLLIDIPTIDKSTHGIVEL